MAIQTVNPFDSKVIHSFQEMNVDQVDAAIKKNHQVFESWKNSSFDTRAQLLHKAAEIMRKNKDKYAQTITLEVGKLIDQAHAKST